MSRIRSIKPETSLSETLGRVSRDARLTFILLWPQCDDSGRTRAASRMLASLLYPYDDDAPGLIEGWLSELEREGSIIRYKIDANVYIQVTNWLKHQKIDRPSKSRIPEFDEASRNVASPREASSTDLGPRTLDLDLGKDLGKVSEVSICASQVSAPSKTQEQNRERTSVDWEPSEDDLKVGRDLGYTDAECRWLLEGCRDWCAEKRKRLGAARYRNWLRSKFSRDAVEAQRRGLHDGREPAKGLVAAAARLAARHVDDTRGADSLDAAPVAARIEAGRDNGGRDGDGARAPSRDDAGAGGGDRPRAGEAVGVDDIAGAGPSRPDDRNLRRRARGLPG